MNGVTGSANKYKLGISKANWRTKLNDYVNYIGIKVPPKSRKNATFWVMRTIEKYNFLWLNRYIFNLIIRTVVERQCRKAKGANA